MIVLLVSMVPKSGTTCLLCKACVWLFGCLYVDSYKNQKNHSIPKFLNGDVFQDILSIAATLTFLDLPTTCGSGVQSTTLSVSQIWRLKRHYRGSGIHFKTDSLIHFVTTKWVLLPPAFRRNGEGYVFIGVCLSTREGGTLVTGQWSLVPGPFPGGWRGY